MVPESDSHQSDDKRKPEGPLRLGVVSFLNARPLIEGLRDAPDCQIVYEVPSRLGALLDRGEVDVASVPLVDYLQRRQEWELVSDACIASDGPTMTVRVLSRVPPAKVGVLHVDGDSHTSVVLARLVWIGVYGREIETRPLPCAEKLGECEAALLIGDKTVRWAAAGFEHEVDLGAAWKEWTHLPMVFAVWAGRRGRCSEATARRLSEARNRGVARLFDIAREEASDHGWPVELATRYLREHLQYRLGNRHRAAIDRFHSLAVESGLVPQHESRGPNDGRKVSSCPS